MTYSAGVPALYYNNKNFARETDNPYPGVDAQVNFMAVGQTEAGPLVGYVNLRLAGQLAVRHERRREGRLQQRPQRLGARRARRSGVGSSRRARDRRSTFHVRLCALGLFGRARLFLLGQYAGDFLHLSSRQPRGGRQRFGLGQPRPRRPDHARHGRRRAVAICRAPRARFRRSGAFRNAVCSAPFRRRAA